MKRCVAVLLLLLFLCSSATAELRFASWGVQDAAKQCALATRRYAYAWPKSQATWTHVHYRSREAYWQAFRANPQGFADVALVDAAMLHELSAGQPFCELEQFAGQLDLDTFAYVSLVAVTALE